MSGRENFCLEVVPGTTKAVRTLSPSRGGPRASPYPLRVSVSSRELCPDPTLPPTNKTKHSADGRTPCPVTPQPSTPVSIPTDKPALRPSGISHRNPSFHPSSSVCQHPVPGSGHPSTPAPCRGLGGSLPTFPPASILAPLCTVARGLQEGEPEHISTLLTEPPSVSRWLPAVWSSPAYISPLMPLLPNWELPGVTPPSPRLTPPSLGGRGPPSCSHRPGVPSVRS